jgi:ketosteroid isomerase-like protein
LLTSLRRNGVGCILAMLNLATEEVTMEQSTELKNLILQSYEALSKGHYSFFERHLSKTEGVLVIGTDPNERWSGYATIAKEFKAQMAEIGGFSVSAGTPQAYSEGALGWAADRAKFKLPDGSEIPVRLTLVFRKESSEWKIVLWHASFGVPNEDLIGKAITTQ